MGLSESHKRSISRTRILNRIAKGKNNPMYGQAHSKEARKKMSDRKTGKPISEAHKKAIREGSKSYLRKKKKMITSDGYIKLHRPDHPNATNRGQILEHRYKSSIALQRPLKPKEEVHHLDLDKRNNKLNNLLVFKNNSIHNKFHRLIYKYILEKYGIKEIKKYVKWFLKQEKDKENVLMLRS